MESKKRRFAWKISLIFLAICISGLSHGQGIGNLTEVCKDTNTQSRAMAKVAGYDIDQLCSKFNSNTPEIAKNITPEQKAVSSRETVSSDDKVIPPITKNLQTRLEIV